MCETDTDLLKNDILESECSEDVWLVKSSSNINLGYYGVKESVVICAHVHVSQLLLVSMVTIQCAT